MCMLAVDRRPSSLAGSLPLVREVHPFSLHCSTAAENPTQPLNPSRSAGTSSIMEPHLTSLVTLHGGGGGARQWNLQVCEQEGTTTFLHKCHKEKRQEGDAEIFSCSRTVRYAAAQGLSTPWGAAHQEVRCHKKCLSSLKESCVSQNHMEDRLKHWYL